MLSWIVACTLLQSPFGSLTGNLTPTDLKLSDSGFVARIEAITRRMFTIVHRSYRIDGQTRLVSLKRGQDQSVPYLVWTTGRDVRLQQIKGVGAGWSVGALKRHGGSMNGWMIRNLGDARRVVAVVLQLDRGNWRVVSRVTTRWEAARIGDSPAAFAGDDLLVTMRSGEMKRLAPADPCPHAISVTKYRLVGGRYVGGKPHCLQTAVLALDEFFDAVITQNPSKAKALCPDGKERSEATAFILHMSKLMPQQGLWGGSLSATDIASEFIVDDHGIFTLARRNGRWVISNYRPVEE